MHNEHKKLYVLRKLCIEVSFICFALVLDSRRGIRLSLTKISFEIKANGFSTDFR
jgi:hypothetical protein